MDEDRLSGHEGWEQIRPKLRIPHERMASYVAHMYWGDRGLRDGVEAGGVRRGDQVAIIDNRSSLSWSELSRLVAAAVELLLDAGIATGEPVLLIAGNSIEGLVAYHGLLRVGASAVVLDCHCGPADVRGAIEAVRPGAVIAPQREIDRLRPDLGHATLYALEEFRCADGQLGGQTLGWVEPDRNEVAVVLFTSGTTGRPKGVTHSLNTLTSGARNMALVTDADSSTVIFLVSPLTSITGIMQMHLAADQHATLVLEDDFDPEASLDRIRRYGATLLGGAPVIVERLVGAADARGGRDWSLRTLALGGSMLPRPLLERMMDEYGVTVARVYGSSEAPNATGSLPGEERERRLADDGALMPGTEVRVGSREHPQEGLVRGPSVFLGYLEESDDDEAFEGSWYRTGDLFEVAGGRLTVVGRLKEVVNRNGFKISLSEIDAAIFDLPGLEEGASFAVPDVDTGERLAVAIRSKAGSEATLEGVLAHLRGAGVATRRLPEQLVIWDEPLPRTASGKVIRSRLAMDAPSKPSLLAPRISTEQDRSNPETEDPEV
jgi:acyl-CoA synthetase (AMP-forming)/AMP-acid ligase II